MAYPLWASIVTLLALVLQIWVAAIVGKYRVRYGVDAPATTGNPHFERAYRVQMNTIENTLVFLPALWLATRWGSPLLVPVAGVLWVGARVAYALAYLKDPAKRSLAFGASFFAIVVLMIDAAVGIARALLG